MRQTRSTTMVRIALSAVSLIAGCTGGDATDITPDEASDDLRRCRRGTVCDAGPSDAPTGTDAGALDVSAGDASDASTTATDAVVDAPPPPPTPSGPGCVGSGLSWACGPGTATADVQKVVDAASDGATVYFGAGAYAWSTITLAGSHGVTLACATRGACDVTAQGNVVQMSLSGSNAHLYRVSGFHFKDAPAGTYLIWFWGNGTLSQVRIDHNVFSNLGGSIAVLFGETSSVGQFYGVIDHNTANGPDNFIMVHMLGATNDSPPPSPKGTANNLFIEDNVLSFDKVTNTGAGCMDSWGGASIVWRHNASTNCLVTSHGVVHNGGPFNFELYGNQLAVNAGSSGSGLEDGYRLFHHQGSGEVLAFDNTFTAYTGKTGTALSMTHYRSATPSAAGYSTSLGRCDGTAAIDGNRSPQTTYFGYPCWRQPGRDGHANLQPMYVWNNRWSDTLAKIDMVVENPWGATNPSVSQHIAANRDYYNAVSAAPQTSPTSPFDGASGTGFGTLANRPATCTTNTSEAGGGVGYFATDDGQLGTLYRCSAMNTWTVQYRPYAYPHPLAR